VPGVLSLPGGAADRGAGPAGPPLLAVRGLSRRWPGVQALADVTLEGRAGEVLAIVGANGAGKSTLMTILAGAVAPSAGEILIDGRPVRFASPAEARAAGIATVYQEFSLVPLLSVARNVWLGREPTGRFGLVDRAAMLADTRALFARHGLSPDPEAEVGSLGVAAQQEVELARALTGTPRVLILDEPTAVLARSEQERLFAIVRGLRAAGLLVLYVSHHLEEVLRIADRVAVLRDGRLVAVEAAAAVSVPWLVARMMGDVAVPAAGGRAATVAGPRWRLAWQQRGGASTLEVSAGEVLGLAGLVGSGRSSMARALVGAGPRWLRAEVQRDGRPLRIADPAAALGQGIVYLTEDRKREGIFANRPVLENAAASLMALCRLAAPARMGRARRRAGEVLSRLRLVSAGLERPVATLSGGNQQKVAIGRALLTDPQLLICDEPTRGVDVAAKAEIHAILRDLAARGVAVIVISSEFEELLAVAGRIATVRAGRVVAESPAGEASVAGLLAAAAGVVPAPLTGGPPP